MTEPVQTPGYNGCEWPLDPACFDAEWEALDPETKARAASLASATLHRLSGYRVGGCPITVRPCKRGCRGSGVQPSYYALAGPYGLSWYPMNYNGVWINSCGCLTDCSCESLCDLRLPGPIGAVYEVKVDGTALPTADYRVDGMDLVYTGAGDCPFPTCQDMTADDDQPNTFSVTYLNSYPPDQMAAYACAVLAMEFAQACAGNACRLPSTVTSVIRQGLSFQVPVGAFPGGVTGIREVDTWIGLWNPNNIRQATGVWSPDLRTPRVVNP